MTDYRVLGALRITTAGGDRVAVRGARERALLVRLLLDAGRIVPVSTLVDDLWPPDHASAARSLQVRVSALRRDVPAAVDRVGDGYRIDVDPDRVDALRFERDVSAAGRAPAAAALPLVDRALGVWPGVPLPELSGLPAARHADRYMMLWEQAREVRGRALLDLGRTGDAVTALSGLLADAPLRESAAVLLVRALYAAGRAADALDVQRATLTRLADEGLDATPQLRDLETAVLRHELPGAPMTGAPAPLGPQRSPDGDERRLDTPRVGDDGSVPRAVPSLGGARGPLLGRSTDLRRARAALVDDRARLLTLWGPGGVGKTRLALAVVDAVADAFDGAPAVVDGASLSDPGEVPFAVAAALGAAMTGASAAELGETLRGRRALILIDNVEHLTAAAPFLADLLAAAPQLQVLTTSRVVLAVRAERVQRLEPLPVTDADGVDVGEIDATSFLVARAQVLAGFAANGDDRVALSAIAAQLDGLPLALELAAARLRMLSPHALRQQIAERLDVLGGVRDLPERQRSLHAVLEWSADLLDQPTRMLLVRLGVFSGRVPLEAIAEICEVPDVVERLADLVDHALVLRVDTADGVGAFVLLETVRRWARERLAQEEPDSRTADRHASWFLRLAERAAPELLSPRQRDWTLRLNDMGPDIEQARRHLLAVGRRADARTMILALWRWRWGVGGWDMIIECLREVSGPLPGPPGDRVRVLAALSHALADQGRAETASAAIETALALARGLDEPLPLAEAVSSAASVLMHRGEPDGALERYVEAHELFLRAGAEAFAAETLVRAGAVAGMRGDLDRSEALSRQALPVYQATGPHWELAALHNNLAHIALLRGDVERAHREVQTSLAIYDDLPSTNFVWSAYDTLGRVRRERGDLAGARRAVERALELAVRAGDRLNATYMRVEAAGIAAEVGDLAAAGAHLRAAVAVEALDVPDAFWQYVLAATVQLALAAGDRDRAARLFCAARGFPNDPTMVAPEGLDALAGRFAPGELETELGTTANSDAADAVAAVRDAVDHLA